MGEVIAAPMEKWYRTDLPRGALYKEPEPPDEVVWAMCSYTRSSDSHQIGKCRRCPKWREHPKFGTVQDGCYGLAQEAIRTVHAAGRQYEQRKARGE